MSDKYLHALEGGALIGLAAAVLMLFNGNRLGMSGILKETLRRDYGLGYWRICFLLGMFIPVILGMVSRPASTAALWLAVAGGLTGGLGAGMGNGCTSGHGVCGLANFSRRSLAATLTFMLTAFITVSVMHYFGWLS